jgi:hypothetical protein
MIQLVQSKGLSLYELVLGLGLSVGIYPYNPSDCFSYHGVDKETEKIFRENKVASLTKLIKSVIPPDKILSGKYPTADELVYEVKSISKKGKNQYNDTAAVKYAPNIVESGIEKLIGFYIVRDLDETMAFSQLVEMREVILAVKNHQQVTIKACYKGPNAEASFESSMALLRAQGKRIITDRFCLLMFEYLSNKLYIGKDKNAGKLLEELANDNQKLLPPSDKE